MNDLIPIIIEMSEPSIDVKLYFKIKPGKVDGSRIQYLLGTRHGLIYILDSKTLHDFTQPGTHVIRRPVTLDWIRSDGLTSFNEDRATYTIEADSINGKIHANAQWLTYIPVLIKGSCIHNV